MYTSQTWCLFFQVLFSQPKDVSKDISLCTDKIVVLVIRTSSDSFLCKYNIIIMLLLKLYLMFFSLFTPSNHIIVVHNAYNCYLAFFVVNISLHFITKRTILRGEQSKCFCVIITKKSSHILFYFNGKLIFYMREEQNLFPMPAWLFTLVGIRKYSHNKQRFNKE